LSCSRTYGRRHFPGLPHQEADAPKMEARLRASFARAEHRGQRIGQGDEDLGDRESGSSALLQSLLKADLIDEFRVSIFPVILGRGKRPRLTSVVFSARPSSIFADSSQAICSLPVRGGGIARVVDDLLFRRWRKLEAHTDYDARYRHSNRRGQRLETVARAAHGGLAYELDERHDVGERDRARPRLFA
jgi:hypothetical protein